MDDENNQNSHWERIITFITRSVRRQMTKLNVMAGNSIGEIKALQDKIEDDKSHVTENLYNLKVDQGALICRGAADF